MKNILTEFKAFAMRGNVMDMAVGVIVGGAFGKIVTSLVSDLIMPVVGLLVGGVNFTDLKITLKDAAVDAAGVAVPAVTLNYGNFLQVMFDFIIIAFSIFMMVKALNSLKKKEDETPVEKKEVPVSDDVKLLTEIRDLLKEKK